MNLRGATRDDVEAVLTLEQELFGVDAWSRGSVAGELTGPRRHGVVSCDDRGSIIGYAVTMLTDDVLDLQRIAVAPGHRRAGVARELLGEVWRAGRAEGAVRLLLEVSAGNGPALAFYAAEGFEQLDRRPGYYRDGADALVLCVALGADADGVGR